MAAYTVTHNSSESSLLETTGAWQLPASKKYRSHFEIIASILDVSRINSEDKYSIMKRTSVNYAQLEKYLGFLTRIRFMEVEMRGQKIQYCATEKGLAFLRQYRILLGMLADTFLISDQDRLVCQPECVSIKKPEN